LDTTEQHNNKGSNEALGSEERGHEHLLPIRTGQDMMEATIQAPPASNLSGSSTITVSVEGVISAELCSTEVSLPTTEPPYADLTATGLPGHLFRPNPNPYATISIDDEPEQRTSVVPKSRPPKWKESFTLLVVGRFNIGPTALTGLLIALPTHLRPKFIFGCWTSQVNRNPCLYPNCSPKCRAHEHSVPMTLSRLMKLGKVSQLKTFAKRTAVGQIPQLTLVLASTLDLCDFLKYIQWMRRRQRFATKTSEYFVDTAVLWKYSRLSQ
jgi:hypothetical protein